MKSKNKRFNTEFLSLFKNDLKLNDISNLIKIRNTFKPESLNKYLSSLKTEERKVIIENVTRLLLTKYIDSLNIITQDVIGYIPESGETVSIARLKSNKGDIRYLCIGDNNSISKEEYNETDFVISIKGYVDHEFLGTQLIDCISYGTGNYIDYYFFNCLNLKQGSSWINVDSEGDFEYTFDTLTYNLKQDQKFELVGMKDFHGQDLYDKSLVWLKFTDTDKYKAVINFDKKSGRCLVNRPEIGLSFDISKHSNWKRLTELQKIK